MKIAGARGQAAQQPTVILKFLGDHVQHLALAVHAPELYLLTGVPGVQLRYGTPQAETLKTVTVAEARRYLSEGHFPAGSMGPKMLAACEFLEGGGSRVLITDPAHLLDALQGNSGTWIVTDS